MNFCNKKFPLCWKKYIVYVQNMFSSMIIFETAKGYHKDILMSFFEEQGIYISIEHEQDWKITVDPHWYYRIETEFNDDCIYSDYTGSTPEQEEVLEKTNLNAKNRNNAVIGAIEKAFELLENHLKEIE